MQVGSPTYSIAKRGNRYYVAWWENSRPQRVSCRTADESEACRFLAEFLAGLNATPIPATPTVGKILDGYLSARSDAHSPETLRHCCVNLKRHLADLPVELLTGIEVTGYITKRRKEGAQGASAQYRERVRHCRWDVDPRTWETPHGLPMGGE